MNQILASISKTGLAMLLILGGVVFVLLNDPPRTACDSQIETFKKSIEGHLVKGTSTNKKLKYSLAPKFKEHKIGCTLSNSPGGCYEWFTEASYVLDLMDTMSRECRQKISSIDTIKKFFWGSLLLLNQIAWGDNGPELEMDKRGWFETTDVRLFCRLKERAKKFYGKEIYKKFQLKLVEELPGAKEMGAKKSYQKMLMSMRCIDYL